MTAEVIAKALGGPLSREPGATEPRRSWLQLP
jgi:hypothetical protein